VRFVVLMALVGRAAFAQDEALDRDHGFIAGTVREQLDRDTTLVPYGKGAVFVPAMTDPLDEPPVAVYSGPDRVADGTTGQRIVLSPGTYDISIGSGAREQRMSFQATVKERFTTVVPVSWAGLTVHVVDERFGSIRQSYEIIRVEDRAYVGLGFGTDEQAGEPVTTWLLAPGLYKIVRVGESYRARRDFAAVRLVEGHHTHFLLVLDPATGEFQGGGEVPAEDVFRAREGFYGDLVLGGDLSFNHRDNVPNLPDGLSFAFRAFVDARASVEIFESPLLLQLQVEEGQTKQPSLPFQKTNDRLDVDLLYVYQLTKAIGPYVRFGGETNLLPTRQAFDVPKQIVLLDSDGKTPLGDPIVDDDVKLSEPIGLTTLREGAGLNMRLYKLLWSEMTLRAGVGARHTLARRDVFLLVDALSDTDNKFYRRIPTVNRFGVEATLLAFAQLTRWVLINLEVDTLVPFNGFDKTVVELEGSIALKLTSYVSVNYVGRFLLDRLVSPEDQLQQEVLLRFSVEVF
jgi:hypothetical protein